MQGPGKQMRGLQFMDTYWGPPICGDYHIISFFWRILVGGLTARTRQLGFHELRNRFACQGVLAQHPERIPSTSLQ